MTTAAIEIEINRPWDDGSVTRHRMILPLDRIVIIVEEGNGALVITTENGEWSTVDTYDAVRRKYDLALRYQQDPKQPSLY